MGFMVDDRLHSNPHWLDMSADEAKLWITGLSWLRDQRQPGEYVIPTGVARGLAAAIGVKAAAITGLVTRCRWHEVEGGYEVHGAVEWDQRNAASERARRAAEARWRNADALLPQKPSNAHALRTQSVTHARAHGPVPDPDPEPVSIADAIDPPVVPRKLIDATACWNAHCAPLPTLRKPPSDPRVARLLLAAWAHFDADEGAFGAAVERAARDPLYRQQRHGVEAFCRHVTRWDGEDVAARPWSPITDAIRRSTEAAG
jgi:hypothetical protein